MVPVSVVSMQQTGGSSGKLTLLLLRQEFKAQTETPPRFLDSRVYLSMLFCRFLIHEGPTLASTLALYFSVHARPSCSVDVHGTVTPSGRRVMHRTLALPVCTLQPAQPQGQAFSCSPGYLGRPNNRRRLPSSTCNNVGPSFGKKRMPTMCCPRSGLLTIRVRGLPHIRGGSFLRPGHERLAPGEASMAVQQQLSWLW